jgi:gliding motility-associated-like protein
MMRIITLLFFACNLVLNSLSAQIAVSNTAPNNNPMWLVQNVFVGPAVPVLPQWPAPATSNQIGYFTANVANFGIDTGIVMVTAGFDDVVPGINSNIGSGPATDADLQTVLTAINSSSTNLNDLVVIEFDFVATSDSISFVYVFASKEYTGYTCSPFNDVFGFFLSGNGINNNPGFSKINLATIPGTTIPVAINTINQGFPSGSYPASTCAAANPNYVANSVYYVGNSSQAGVNMAGWTVPLTAKAQVTCGNVYRIKLAIADVADGALNSAVFLKAKSFKTPEIIVNPIFTNAAGQPDTIMTEGCQPTPLVFKKQGNVSYPMTIHYTIGGSAVNGVDYAAIPDSIYIPAGVIQDTVWIEAINDQTAEPIETITLTLANTITPCFVYPSQVITLKVRDKNPTVATISSTVATDTLDCPGDLATLLGSAAGGEPPLYFQWEGGVAGDPYLNITPLNDTTVRFWVWDNCFDSVQAVHTIYVRQPVPITIQVDSVEICAGDPALISISYNGGTGVLGLNWLDGANGNARTVYPNATTPYAFVVVDGCGQVIADTAWVTVHPLPVATFSATPAVNEKWTYNFDAPIQVNCTYAWDFGDGDTSTAQSVRHVYALPGSYLVSLTVTTDEGCVQFFQRLIEVKSDLVLWIPEAFTPNGDGVNDMYTVSVTGHEKFEMLIYNRWGELVFQSEDPALGWNGTMANGAPAPTGVYLVRVFVILPDKTISTQVSEFTLFH